MKKEIVIKKSSDDDLLNRLFEAEEIIEAIKNNKIDALLISTNDGERVYTLKDADLPYRAILENMNEGAATFTDDGVILFANKKFCELLNVPNDNIVGSSIFKWIAISDLSGLTSFLHENKESARIDLNLLSNEGNLVIVSVTIASLTLINGEVIKYLIATDLTEKTQNEKISAAEKFARSMIEQATEAIIVCDENTKIIRASKGAEKLAGDDLLNKYFDSIFYLENGEKENITLKSAITSSLPFQSEVLFSRIDGEVFHLIFNIGILSGTQNNILGYIINLTNITKRVLEEEKITASLKEKTVLLKEIHHRIKNNLQIVSSLLNIQASYIKDTAIQAIFQDCQQRVNSMALIHQKLYESKSLSEVNIAGYVKDLIRYLCGTNLFNANSIKIVAPDDNISFPIESAIPIGLILNELLTNCFKHAFPDADDPEIIITLFKENDKTFCASVKDNGIGIPENFNMQKTETLGLQLVNTLIDQLSGSVEVISDNGTEFRILVPFSIHAI